METDFYVILFAVVISILGAGICVSEKIWARFFYLIFLMAVVFSGGHNYGYNRGFFDAEIKAFVNKTYAPGVDPDKQILNGIRSKVSEKPKFLLQIEDKWKKIQSKDHRDVSHVMQELCENHNSNESFILCCAVLLDSSLPDYVKVYALDSIKLNKTIPSVLSLYIFSHIAEDGDLAYIAVMNMMPMLDHFVVKLMFTELSYSPFVDKRINTYAYVYFVSDVLENIKNYITNALPSSAPNKLSK